MRQNFCFLGLDLFKRNCAQGRRSLFGLVDWTLIKGYSEIRDSFLFSGRDEGYAFMSLYVFDTLFRTEMGKERSRKMASRFRAFFRFRFPSEMFRETGTQWDNYIPRI